MNLRKLRELRIKLNDIEDFKKIVQEAIDGEGKFKEFGYWLDEEYSDSSVKGDSSNSFRAIILCVNESYNENTQSFSYGYKSISAINVYDIFYTDFADGRFIIDNITIGYSAIKAIKGLKKNKKN